MPTARRPALQANDGATGATKYQVSPMPTNYSHFSSQGNYYGYTCVDLPYLLDQTPLSISRRSQIVAAPPDALNEIVATPEY